jgi:hypothetical protein
MEPTEVIDALFHRSLDLLALRSAARATAYYSPDLLTLKRAVGPRPHDRRWGWAPAHHTITSHSWGQVATTGAEPLLAAPMIVSCPSGPELCSPRRRDPPLGLGLYSLCPR